MSRISCFSPNTGLVLEEIDATADAEIASALDRQSSWPVPRDVRVAALSGMLRAISDSQEELTKTIVAEVGKTWDEARGEVEYAATFIQHSLEWLEGSDRAEPMINSGVRARALGLALLITPYNDPLAGITRKVAPAIAAGCTVFVKPSPLGSLTAKRLFSRLPEETRRVAEIAYTAQPEQIRKLILADEVKVVSMTGSTVAGRAIAAAAAERPIPALLELGGNCPFVAFEDCDIERAVQDLLDRKVRAAGQACSSVNRVLVHERVEKQFIDALRARLTSYVCGVSDLAGVKYGPVRTLEAVRRLNHMEERSVAAGASVIARGPRDPGSGRAYCWPLSVLAVAGKSVLDEEESFGPLMSIQSFAHDREVEEMLARNRQNLVAYFYGARAGAFVAGRPGLRFGSIGVNTTKIQGAAVPTGGFDEAGYGREGGTWGIEAFRTTVNVRSA